PLTQQMIPRKYFSGGVNFDMDVTNLESTKLQMSDDPAMLSGILSAIKNGFSKLVNIGVDVTASDADLQKTARMDRSGWKPTNEPVPEQVLKLPYAAWTQQQEIDLNTLPPGSFVRLIDEGSWVNYLVEIQAGGQIKLWANGKPGCFNGPTSLLQGFNSKTKKSLRPGVLQESMAFRLPYFQWDPQTGDLLDFNPEEGHWFQSFNSFLVYEPHDRAMSASASTLEQKSKERRLKAFSEFLVLDGKLKDLMHSPLSTDHGPEDTDLANLRGEISGRLSQMQGMINMMADNLAAQNGVSSQVKDKLKARAGFLAAQYPQSYDYGSIKQWYDRLVSGMSSGFLDEVNNGIAGWLDLDNNLLRIADTAASFNELLNLVHKYSLVNAGILNGLSVWRETPRAANLGGGIIGVGEETPVAANIYIELQRTFNILKAPRSPDYAAYHKRWPGGLPLVVYIFSLPGITYLMVRDYGHALFIEVKGSVGDQLVVTYKIPKAFSREAVSHLSDVVYSEKTDTASGQLNLQDSRNIGSVLADFIRKVPTDDSRWTPANDQAMLGFDVLKEWAGFSEFKNSVKETFGDDLRALRNLGFTGVELKEAMDGTMALQWHLDADFEFNPVQTQALTQEFIKLVDQRAGHDQYIVMYAVGLGQKPTEAMEAIKLFYQVLGQKGQDPRQWRVSFIGADISDSVVQQANESFKALVKSLGLTEAELRMTAVKANALRADELQKVYENQGRGQKADIILNRHTHYGNHFSSMGFFQPDRLKQDVGDRKKALNVFLQIKNIFNAFARPSCLYLTERVPLLDGGRSRLIIPGAVELVPEEGIYRVAQTNKVSSLSEFLKGLRSPVSQGQADIAQMGGRPGFIIALTVAAMLLFQLPAHAASKHHPSPRHTATRTATVLSPGALNVLRQIDRLSPQQVQAITRTALQSVADNIEASGHGTISVKTMMARLRIPGRDFDSQLAAYSSTTYEALKHSPHLLEHVKNSPNPLLVYNKEVAILISIESSFFINVTSQRPDGLQDQGAFQTHNFKHPFSYYSNHPLEYISEVITDHWDITMGVAERKAGSIMAIYGPSYTGYFKWIDEEKLEFIVGRGLWNGGNGLSVQVLSRLVLAVNVPESRLSFMSTKVALAAAEMGINFLNTKSPNLTGVGWGHTKERMNLDDEILKLFEELNHIDKLSLPEAERLRLFNLKKQEIGQKINALRVRFGLIGANNTFDSRIDGFAAGDLQLNVLGDDGQPITAPTDAAQLTKGGIDLTRAKMNLQTLDNGRGIRFNFDASQLARWQNAPGFVPVIIHIQPVGDLRGFLGIA
ncbi:MAG: hypothetical protein KGJ11_03330, partial [Candidatus Omnitrophica bacterium]|nr:hypothetical protein [Candidatus Omnitrophota bacterium]